MALMGQASGLPLVAKQEHFFCLVVAKHEQFI